MWLFYNDTSESMIRHSREKNRYLRLEGIVPHHKIPPPGKQMGRTQSEYNEATHFNKKELKKNENNLHPVNFGSHGFTRFRRLPRFIILRAFPFPTRSTKSSLSQAHWKL